MPTPAAEAVYGATHDAMGAAALAILVSLLRMLAQKGTLSPDDVEAVLDHAEKIHSGSTVSRRRDAARVIGQMRQLIE
jgi:hypothetical protein